MRLIYLIMSLLIIVTSCGQSENDEEVHFSEVKILIGKKLTSIDPYKLVDMQVIDDLLVVVNNKGKFIFQIYQTSNDSLIFEAGLKGRGPNEFYDPLLAMQYDINNLNSASTIKVFDAVKRRIIEIDLDTALKSKKLLCNQQRLPVDLGVVDRVLYQNDSIIYYKGENEGRLSIYYVSNSTKKSIPYVGAFSNYSIPKNYERNIYDSEVQLNMSCNRIVTAPNFLGQLDYYDLNGKYLYSSIYENKKDMLKKINRGQAVSPKMHVTDIKSHDGIIYALNVNCFDPDSNIKQNTNSEVLLFDWNGKPIMKYKLDRTIGYFAVDYKNKCIYGYAPFEHDYSIVKYEL